MVTARGGSPSCQTIILPDEIGSFVELPPFPNGVLAPGRLIVGDLPEVTEPEGNREPLTIQPGALINGRLATEGEVNRYRVAVKTGDRLRIKVIAWELGSWLDSVVVVRDAKGKIVAENDDAPVQGGKLVGPRTTDSLLDVVATSDDLTLELSDRYGKGGPEYGYRLEVAPPRPRLAATVALSRLRTIDPTDQKDQIPVTTDSFTLERGLTAVLTVNLETEGGTGPITVSAEGLPPGLTAEPVVVEPRINPAGRVGPPSVVTTSQLLIRAVADAPTGSGSFRVVATAEPEDGHPLRATASALVILDNVKFATPYTPVTRSINRFFVKVKGS